MATGTEFCLLGPLTVRFSGTVLPVARGKQRALLAALLLNANRVVSLDELADTLWASEPPASARVTVQNYIKRLRQALAATGEARISTQPGGYLMSVANGELDVTRFEALLSASCAAAREAAWQTAASQAGAALSLWRGEPLADVPSELLAQRQVPRLAELRMQALQARIEADLHLGRHAELVGELWQLTGAHPLREHLNALLMLALYRGGRQAEALAAYADARKVLITELGSEPGPELRELHQRILTADPALAVPEPGPPATSYPRPTVPRLLPAIAPHFTGRASEMTELTRLLGEVGEQARGTVVISAIGGTAGVGKTTLAVQWAHQMAEHFPDGQLYVNLRGYDPGQPVSAADALAGFLRVLGVPSQDIPLEEDERAARYRSLLAGRHVLIVLDNAGEVEQVRPLLPGAPGCAVVVTSRDDLAGLVARDGAKRLDLDLLPLADAISLLRALIGDRVDSEPEAAAMLAGQCARLPLALRVAAELAAARSATPMAELVAELASQQRRLDLLDAGGDPRTAVRAVFSWSCRHLDTDTGRMFRLLGLHPGLDFDRYAAAALIGTEVDRARPLLDTLARAHLIHTTRPGRYGLHDLLRAYAAEQAAACESASERQAALTRLFDYYLCTTAVAMDALFPAESFRRPRIPPAATPAPLMTAPGAARAWLDAERATLVAVAAHAAACGWPAHTVRLGRTLFRYLDSLGGYYPEAVIIHGHARRAAGSIGDRVGEAAAMISLSLVDLRQGRCQQAATRTRRALALCRQAGDQIGETRALINLGLVATRLGRCVQAAVHLELALAIARQAGCKYDQAAALNNLACVEERLGRYQQAADHLEQARTLAREFGDRFGEAYTLANLGCVYRGLCRYHEASSYLRQGLAMSRECGDRFGEANALAGLGLVDLRQGRYRQASDHHQEALALLRAIGDRAGEAEALNGFGEVLLATAQPAQARRQHTAALNLASQTGDRYEQARAHKGLAQAYQDAGNHGQARHHWQEALAIYADLNATEADQIRAQLTAANGRLHVRA
jgi:DNA-binding SARP family transcriptional activator/Tfp pilus assembly protein PilF